MRPGRVEGDEVLTKGRLPCVCTLAGPDLGGGETVLARPGTVNCRLGAVILGRATLPRRAAGLAAVALALTAASGCHSSVPNPSIHIAPGDGVAVSVGDLDVRNLLVVVDAKGSTGSAAGTVVNPGSAATTVMVRTMDEALQGTKGPEVAVPAGGIARLDGVPVTAVPAPPGAMVTLVLSTPASGDVQVLVPVVPLAGDYATATPTATPTVTAPATP